MVIALAWALVLPAIAPTAAAAAPLTYTVTTVQDLDGTCSVSVCSLRQAINSANKNPGRDTIRFSIPGDVVPHTLQPTKELPSVKEAVVIDGTTEPNFNQVTRVPVVEIDGSRAPAGAVGLRISGGGSTVRGLAINRFGTRGSSTTGASGILIEKAGGNVIEGNFLGTDAAGHTNRGNRIAGISIDRSSDNIIGGSTAAARNVVSGNGTGIAISGQSGVATRNLILGNYVGVDAEGDNKLGNQEGIRISQAAGNTIGGLTDPEANVISANAGAGVHIGGTGSQRNVVQGNFIGTDAAGTANFGNFRGLFFVSGALDNTVGGTAPGAGNVIAFNSETGVLVTDTTGGRSVQIRILGNSIHSNGIPGLTGLGIDLTPMGVNSNDAGDVDLGANRKMNFPVLSSAVATTSIDVAGTLHSEASTSFRLEFFASPSCDTTGYGEGQDLVGTQSVTTSASGDAAFAFSADSAVPIGWFITSTSTQLAFGNTSEFSACRLVTGPPDPLSWVVNTVGDTTDSRGCTVLNCTLREAMTRANAEPGRDTITFNIPGTPVEATHMISPAAPLPPLLEPTVLDGTTEPDFVAGPVVRIDGAATGAGPIGLEIQGGESEIRGLSLTRWSVFQVLLASDANQVAGNWIGITPEKAPTRVAATGIRITGGGNAIGGDSASDRNVIAAHDGYQIHLSGSGAIENVISGNYIGTDPDGVRTDSGRGILVEGGADRSVIGAASLGGGNRLRAAFIDIRDSSHTVIQNNEADGVPAVSIDGGVGTVIGGDGPFEPNRFGAVGAPMIVIAAGQEHTVIANSIINAEISIDLGNDGVTLNDSGDLDLGPNGFQNFPVLGSADRIGAAVAIEGTLESHPEQLYRVDLYATYGCHGLSKQMSDGHRVFGPLEQWLGYIEVTTDSSGHGTFDFTTLPSAVSDSGNEDAFIVATATGAEGTSEGSWCVPVTEFVEADGTSLTLGGEPWYLHGASIYHASVPGGSGDLTQVLDWAEEAGLNTIRLVNQIDERGTDAEAPYSEAAWVRVDQMLASIGDRGLYAILDLSIFRNHLVNKAILDAGLVENCKPFADRTPVSYAALSPYRADLDDEWDAWMAFVANRVNTVTGVRYQDDPTIAIVSIAGEPGPPNSEECGQAASTEELTDFYDRTMSHWQELDPNHLVSNGGFIHLDWEELHDNPFGSGIDWKAIFSLSANDVPSIHTYIGEPYPVPLGNPPVPFTEYQTGKIAPYVAELGKPWFTEEFGFPQREGEFDDPGRAAYFQQVYDLQADHGSAGAAFWNLGHEVGIGTFDVSPNTPAVWETVQLNAP